MSRSYFDIIPTLPNFEQVGSYFSEMNLKLTNINAVVGGSTQGIGLAIATELALNGANVTLLARDEERLKDTAAALDTAKSQTHDYLVADFTDPKSLESKIASFVKEKPVQILVNNTGGPPGGPIQEADPEEFLAAFNMHLICYQILAKAIIPGMRKAGYGRIINVISTSVRQPIANLGVSNTIRGAVASWAKTMANELAPDGITVNNILPGATETTRLFSLLETHAKRDNVSTEKMTEHWKSQIPMKRFGSPSEIAAVAAFLASPAASYVTGVSLPVDGGRISAI